MLGGKARALTTGATHVNFDDIRALAHPVLRHRMLLNFRAQSEGVTTDAIIDKLLASVRAQRRAMTAPAATPTSSLRGLDPRVLARIDNLELIARTVVEGFLNGLHRFGTAAFPPSSLSIALTCRATTCAASIGASSRVRIVPT